MNKIRKHSLSTVFIIAYNSCSYGIWADEAKSAVLTIADGQIQSGTTSFVSQMEFTGNFGSPATRATSNAILYWITLQQSKESTRGELEVVKEKFDAIISSYTGYGQAYLLRATVSEALFDKYREDTYLKESLRDLTTYVKLKTDSNNDRALPGVLMKIGMAYRKLGDPGNAREAFSAVIERWPASADAQIAQHLLESK